MGSTFGVSSWSLGRSGRPWESNRTQDLFGLRSSCVAQEGLVELT